MAVIRLVHPKHVESNGSLLKPNAFPTSQLKTLGDKQAPSVYLAANITLGNLTHVQDAACRFCRGKQLDPAVAWNDSLICHGRDGVDCSKSPNGVRGAVGTVKRVRQISFTLRHMPHFLDVVEDASRHNAAHALLQSEPRVSEDLDDITCLRLQDELCRTFQCQGTVVDVFKKVACL